MFKLFGKPLGRMVSLIKNNNLATKECVLIHSFHQKEEPIHCSKQRKASEPANSKGLRAQAAVRHAPLPSLSEERSICIL